MALALYSETLGKTFHNFRCPPIKFAVDISTILLTECIIFLHVVCVRSLSSIEVP